jgi:hypothetical protein
MNMFWVSERKPEGELARE